ncbi:ABC transporter permease [Hansschlegelia plantiphila]|uniref:Autoinducer 2 import system permease protein LsrD n=1 Tax=Hansschlegelia plantiphila TaxID=374655 RepID=A0A9W6MVD1_9HYPH|nr:ABC transporter permease [Hansschlegelia plantiphila]GLK67615.1 hypothetical protein GCM10008179_12530 [Hansschlegelia plantiphila]
MTVEATLEAPTDTRRAARFSGEALTAMGLFALSAGMVAASPLISPALGSWSQIYTILLLVSFLLVISFGQGLVILTGGLDLSVGSVMMLGGVLTTTWIGGDSATFWGVMPVVLAFGAGIGALNGIGVAMVGIPPFIMTMGVGIVTASLALGYTGGTTLGAAPPPLLLLMKGDILGAPSVIVFVLLFCLVAWTLQSRTTFGRKVYAIGSSRRAARIAGVPIVSTTILVYATSGLCATLSGAMLVGYSNGATLRMGDPYLLPSIAAVVVGGSSILGGSGNFVNTICGALFLATLESLIAASGLGQGWRTILSGLIIVGALLVQSGWISGVFASVARRVRGAGG